MNNEKIDEQITLKTAHNFLINLTRNSAGLIARPWPGKGDKNGS